MPVVLPGTVITGATVSTTVTANAAAAPLPEPSVPVHVTPVVPTPNVYGDVMTIPLPSSAHAVDGDGS